MEEYEYPILEVGDVVLIDKGGNGFVTANKGLYCVIEEYSDTGYYGTPGYLVSKYLRDLAAHDYDNDWVGVGSFGKAPFVLFNINDEHVVDLEHVAVAKGSKEEVDKVLGIERDEYTGGSSNYYKVFVKNPTTLEEPYEAECNDIIESLKMTFAEGNAFKAIWRKAKARQGVKKKGYDNGVYDSEKVVFFGQRMLVEAKDEN